MGEEQNFGWALKKLKAGWRVFRTGWNDNTMRLILQVPDANSKMTKPYLYLEITNEKMSGKSISRVPWTASQTDLLATDWENSES